MLWGWPLIVCEKNTSAEGRIVEHADRRRLHDHAQAVLRYEVGHERGREGNATLPLVLVLASDADVKHA
jgi:hypothetical protein